MSFSFRSNRGTKPGPKPWLLGKGSPGLFAAGLICMGFILTASECRNEMQFVAAKLEICTDGVDNDDNGKVDCADSYCQAECVLTLTVAPTFSTAADSQLISGTQNHASKIVVQNQRNNEGNGLATLSGHEWSFWARKLLPGENDLTITATDSAGNTKEVKTSIQVTAAKP